MKRLFRFTPIRRFRRVLWREDGAVTIFAVIVLSSLLLFFSLLIDYARIAAFHKLTEDAIRSGVRSVLSAYDSMLYESYGLFGRGGTEGEVIFNDVIHANTEASAVASRQTFVMVQAKSEQATLNTAAYLGSHDVFSRQVLEEMKYKAPINFTLELVSKFAPLSMAMKETSTTVDLLESMRKLYEKREEHAAKALQLQKQAAAVVSGSEISKLIPVQGTALMNEQDTLRGIANGYSAYATQVKHDHSLKQGEPRKYEEEIKAYENKARIAAYALRTQTNELLIQHAKLLQNAFLQLEAARMQNDKMQQLVMKANQQQSNTGYDTVSESGASGTEQNELLSSNTAELQQVKKTAEDLILPESWFSTYKQEIEVQESASVSLGLESGSMQTAISAALSEPSEGLLMKSVNRLQQVYEQYEQSYIQPAAIILQREHLLQNTNVKDQIKQQDNKVGSLWKQARGMLQGFTNVVPNEEHMLVFEQVMKRYENNLLFNQQAEAAEEAAGSLQGDDAHAATEQSTALMGNLFTGIGSMLERSRDTLYYGEYVINRYSTFAPQNLKAMLTSGNLTDLSLAASFNNQEAEYVLYGFHNPVGNIAAAYGELFATRLAIRTMEGLIESRALANPLLILSAAIIYGLEKTMEDMFAFMERGSAPVSKYVKAELSYSDYLRLFMLLHSGNEAARFARMIAVIEQNSGTTLSAVPSAVTGETRMSMELWFIPGLMRALGRFGLLEGKVVGNRYETTQAIGSSY